MVVLYSSAATGQTQWSELGRTNVVANTAGEAGRARRVVRMGWPQRGVRA